MPTNSYLYPNLDLLTQRPVGVGKVFFVDSGGDASNEGTDPNHPLDAVTDALGKCTSGKGDAIIILGLSPSTAEATETFPISVTKANVLIAGLYSRGMLSDSGLGCDETNVALFNIGTNYVTIENLYLGIAAAGSTGGVIEGSASCFAFTLRNCLIEAQYTTTYGFYTGASYDFPYLLIEDCVFGSGQGAKATNWIRLFNASMSSVIRRNLFKRSSATAIKCLASCGELSILDNTFHLNSNLSGGAITLDTGSSNIYVDNNRAGYGATSMSANPFLDSNGDASCTWGLNYNQEEATLPA